MLLLLLSFYLFVRSEVENAQFKKNFQDKKNRANYLCEKLDFVRKKIGAHLSHPPRLAEQSISSNLGTSIRDIRSSTLFQCKNPYTPNMRNTET